MSQTTKIELIKALKNGKGMQYLVNAASKILENPILMHDVDYKLVANAEGVITDDPLWNELINTGEHGGESLKLFRDEGFLDSVANAKTVVLLTSPRVKYDRIFGKVFNQENIMVACIDVVCCYRPFADGDIEAFDAFRKILSKEIAKSAYYQIYGKMYQETLFRKLIDGSIEDRTFYSCHVANIYQDLQDHLFLAIADIANFSADYTELGAYRDLFMRKEPAFKYAIYSNFIIIVMCSPEPKLNAERDLGKLQKLFEQSNINVGISSCFENLFELPKYYQEALHALNKGLKHDACRIFFYEKDTSSKK